MGTELKRITFTLTSDMEFRMNKAKKIFYDSTQSEMIRTLIIAGLDALDAEKERANPTLKVDSDTDTHREAG